MRFGEDLAWLARYASPGSIIGPLILGMEVRVADIDAATFDDVAFLGNALAPFFLQDPRTGDAGAHFAAFAALDAREAAAEWPFVEESEAASYLSLMVDGLRASAAARTGSCSASGPQAGVRVGNVGETPFSADGGRFAADDDLTWEYRRLFVGPGVKPAPPWGSVYTDRDRVVFGASTLELRAWMRERGVARTTGWEADQSVVPVAGREADQPFARATDQEAGRAADQVADKREPEDHIGLMLGLMAWLAQHQPESLSEYLRIHLLTWAGHYLDELARAAEHPFYEGLARLTRASLDGLQESLSLEVIEPMFYR